MIEYAAYTPAHEAELVHLLADVFARFDPPAIAVGLTPEEFQPFVRLLCVNAAADELTMVARLTDTGEMAGALLTEDSAAALPDGFTNLSPKFEPIFDILDRLGSEYRDGRSPARGDVMHLFLLGVKPQFAGRGIAQQLVAACTARGAARGYKTAVTEATNRASQHLFRKQGFVERVTASYAEHRSRGVCCFASIADQGGPILMDKKL